MLSPANGEDLVDSDFGTNVCRYLFYFEFFASATLYCLPPVFMTAYMI
jgi:hypothetical protein